MLASRIKSADKRNFIGRARSSTNPSRRCPTPTQDAPTLDSQTRRIKKRGDRRGRVRDNESDHDIEISLSWL